MRLVQAFGVQLLRRAGKRAGREARNYKAACRNKPPARLPTAWPRPAPPAQRRRRPEIAATKVFVPLEESLHLIHRRAPARLGADEVNDEIRLGDFLLEHVQRLHAAMEEIILMANVDRLDTLQETGQPRSGRRRIPW